MSKRLSDDEKRVFTDQISLLKNENERLTKIVEDYEADNAALKRENERLQKRLSRIEKLIDGDEYDKMREYTARLADENAALKRVRNGLLWLNNNIDNYGTDGFLGYLNAAIKDALLTAEDQDNDQT